MIPTRAPREPHESSGRTYASFSILQCQYIIVSVHVLYVVLQCPHTYSMLYISVRTRTVCCTSVSVHVLYVVHQCPYTYCVLYVSVRTRTVCCTSVSVHVLCVVRQCPLPVCGQYTFCTLSCTVIYRGNSQYPWASI